MESTTTILDELDPAQRGAPPAAEWLDVCHVGVALRALLLVHAVVAIGATFVSPGWQAWLAGMAVASALVTPATLAWLLATCTLQRWSARWPRRLQDLVAVLLGMLCAMGGQRLLQWLGADAIGLDVGVPLAGAAFAAVLMVWIRLRGRAQLPAQTTAQLQELQARIRPHFLFNTLNTAIALVRVDPRRAEGVLEDLADLFRVALIDEGVPSTLGAEIDIARRYLAIESLRFDERLKVRWSIDSRADGARVPPLLLQPLVENAVRHGIEPAEKGGQIHIQTRLSGDQAIIRVSNSLADMPSAPGHGIGLASVRRRLLLMHDVQARFSAGIRPRGEVDAPSNAGASHEGTEFRVEIAVPMPG